MNSIDYFYFDSKDQPGVSKKISQTCSALSDLGWKATSKPVRGRALTIRIRMICNLLKTRADILIFRYEYISPILYFFIFIFHRLCKRKIIIDIPTPLAVISKELLIEDCSSYIKNLKLFLLYLQSPIVLLTANIVLQYANEGRYFTFGIKKRTLLFSNGVKCSDYNQFYPASYNSSCVRMICVGAIASWHGIDRLIMGLYEYHKNSTTDTRFILDIVGSGNELVKLRCMANSLGLNSFVNFHGVLTGNKLKNLYSKSNIGVGTLGLHRKGLDFASPLKNREYCAVGLPIIFSHNDPDFTEVKFCLNLPSDETPVDIAIIDRWYSNLAINSKLSSDIKDYSICNLDYSAKWKNVLTLLKKM